MGKAHTTKSCSKAVASDSASRSTPVPARVTHRASDLLYFADMISGTRSPGGWRASRTAISSLESRPGGLALDYQRGGMFDRRHMRRIPASRPGPDNDLVDELDITSIAC